MKRILILFLVLNSCGSMNEEPQIDIQGHRGARGLMPENTIEAFLKAVELGVSTLELDLVVTGDSQLLVSHEPFFSPEFCQDTLGNRMEDSLMLTYNIYQMDYEEVLKFDCGSISHPRFPDQQKFTVQKPLLKDVLSEVEKLTKEKKLPLLNYNIELKTQLDGDDLFHPKPQVFADLVYDLITQRNLWDRVNIQSFDFRTLQYFKKQYPMVRLALLIENDISWKQNIDSLGFIPEIYSCDYQLLSREIVSDLQDSDMKVIPWTVNEKQEMKKLSDWGVDGIITDYPDRAIELLNR